MKNYTTKSLSIKQLQVDLQNPRLPRSRAFIDPTSVMDYLQEREDVLELAESIADHGFFPSEPLIALEEGGIYSVLEGNRRLVAMKLLYEPERAIKHQAKFKEASNKADLEELDNLNVIIYTDRLAAAPVLIKRHTSDPAKLKPWEMIMKAHYTTSFMSMGKSLIDVANQLSIDIVSLRTDLELLQLYNLAQALPFDATTKEKINDESKFALSTLNRAIRASSGIKMFKLNFNDNEGKLYLTFDKKEFLRPFAKLILDIVNEDFNSRIANTSAEIEGYFNAYHEKFRPNQNSTAQEKLEDVTTYANSLKNLDEIYVTVTPSAATGQTATSTAPELPTIVPTSGATGSTAQTNLTSGGAIPASTTPATASTTSSTGTTPKRKTTVRKRKSVIFQDVSVVKNFSKQRITTIVTELKKINLDDYKNAAAVLLRTLLDIITHEFIKANGEDKIMLAEAKANLKQGQKLRPFWTPNLFPMLNRVTKNKFGLPPTVLSALDKHLTMKGNNNILFLLNEIVHNPDFVFTKQDLLDIYDKLEPYIVEVL